MTEGIEQCAKLTGGGSLEVVRSPDGLHLRDSSLRPMHVRITGGGSGTQSGGGSGALGNCYSGIQLASENDGTVEDLELGLEFDAETYPLVEMTERSDVPVDGTVIVLAWPATHGRNYEFIWQGAEQFESGSGGSGGSGDGCTTTRTVEFRATECIDDVNYTTVYTITFPFLVEVCVTEEGSG